MEGKTLECNQHPFLTTSTVHFQESNFAYQNRHRKMHICYCNNHPFSAPGATLWQWAPSVCGGGWSRETGSGRFAGSCSAPTASSPTPTRRRSTCRRLCAFFPVNPNELRPSSGVPSSKLWFLPLTGPLANQNCYRRYCDYLGDKKRETNKH